MTGSLQRSLAALCAVALLSGCAREAPQAEANGVEGDTAALPRPEAVGGSITGFDGDSPPARPQPQPAPAPSADATAGFDLGTRVPEVAPVVPVVSAAPIAPAAEPGGAEAAAVLDDYYAAINAGRYPSAYGLWSDGGRASGQTTEQFAHGFSDTTRVTANTGDPGRVEGAAGSRYVRIPVAVEAVHRDGSVHRYDGTYTLRRAVVDGASAEQRAWRIASADLREVE